MKRITANDPESKSFDATADNVAQLARLFPEAFTEGKIDFTVLRELLGDALDEAEEKYGLNWHGKRLARRRALTPSTGTLRPCPDESVEWDSTRHLMIDGDNLEVLKLLQKSYTNKVKLIYIDPPYNTGKDFVYRDNYNDGTTRYLKITGQLDGAGDKLCSNTDASGRFHTNWLNMMYPRLKVARTLMCQDGLIAVSIDQQELSNLQKVMDELWGRREPLRRPDAAGHAHRPQLQQGLQPARRLSPRVRTRQGVVRRIAGEVHSPAAGQVRELPSRRR